MKPRTVLRTALARHFYLPAPSGENTHPKTVSSVLAT